MSGQTLNQSIVQQFIILGNWIHLFLNELPTGLKDNTICKESLTVATKYWYTPSFVSAYFASFALSFKVLNITAISSSLNKLGTSPLFNILFISSKKLSWRICVSLNKKACFLLSPTPPPSFIPPDFFNIFPISFKNNSTP